MLKIDPSVEIWPPKFYPMSIINGIELNQITLILIVLILNFVCEPSSLKNLQFQLGKRGQF